MTPLRRAAAFAFAALLAFCASVTARAQAPYILVDAATGDVLGQRRSGELWYPASLTKLMTIYLAFQALRESRLALDSPVVISERAHAAPPARMGFAVGTVVTVENALKMLVVRSANDIAVALAEMLGGTEAAFVADMNRAAERLGLTGTRFVNPHGLPAPGQSTTARDMAALGLALWTGFPQYRALFGIAAIRYGATIIPSPNALLAYYPGADGLKTGFICASGFNVVGSATRAGKTLIVVVLGEATEVARAVTATAILDAGFALPPGAGRTPLATYRPPSVAAAPADRRETVCPGGVTPVEEPAQLEELLTATFGARLALPEPAVVTTGGANVAARFIPDVPLPRLRPPPDPTALGVLVVRPSTGQPPIPRPRP